jgi:endonuclease G
VQSPDDVRSLFLLPPLLFTACVAADDAGDPTVIDDSGKEDGGAGLKTSPNVALGAPKDSSPQDDLILLRSQYVNSYNVFRNGPNWVAWHLVASDVGNVDRQNDFRADTMLPSTAFHVTPADYDNQGFDRGHMCNSEDRSDTLENNQATFFMSNMLPQKHELNAGAWEGLEAYSRSLVAQGSELYIVAGGAYSAACNTHTSSRGNAPSAKCNTMGSRASTAGDAIVVPDSTWKVIVVVDKGDTAKDVTAKSRVIAVNMPNDLTSLSHDWTPYVTTAGAIEKLSGYKLFGNLSPSVASALRSQEASDLPTADQAESTAKAFLPPE